MTTDDHPENKERASFEEPVDVVPEADAVDQHTTADPDGEDDWQTEARDQSLGEAAEADVVDQLRDAGDDEEEWR